MSDVTEHGFCSEHYKKERGLYNYYKETEAIWEGAEKEGYRAEASIEAMESALYYATVTIHARVLHTEWFYPGGECPGHADHLYRLRGNRDFFIQNIFENGYAIVKSDVEEKVYAQLKKGVLEVDTHWTGKRSLIHLLIDFDRD